MPRIYLTYRPSDIASKKVDYIYTQLIAAFGAADVLRSTADDSMGLNYLAELVQSCDALLVLVGQRWLPMVDERGERLLDNPHDYLHVEIEAALTAGHEIWLTTLCLDNATLPPLEALPTALQELTRRNTVSVDAAALDETLADLIEQLKYIDSLPTTAFERVETEDEIPTLATVLKQSPYQQVPAAPAVLPRPTVTPVRRNTGNKEISLGTALGLTALMLVFLYVTISNSSTPDDIWLPEGTSINYPGLETAFIDVPTQTKVVSSATPRPVTTTPTPLRQMPLLSHHTLNQLPVITSENVNKLAIAEVLNPKGNDGDAVVAASANGKWVAIVTRSGVYLHNIHNPSSGFISSSGVTTDEKNAAFSPDSKTLVVHLGNQVYVIYLEKSLTPMPLLFVGSGQVDIDFNASGNRLLITHGTYTMFIKIDESYAFWEDGCDTENCTVAYDPDAYIFGSSNRIIHMPSGREIAVIANRITSMLSGSPFIMGDAEGYVWFGIERSARFELHDAAVTSMVLSPDKHLLASGGADGQVIIFDMNKGIPIFRYRQEIESIRSLAFSGNGKVIFVSYDNGLVNALTIQP